MARSEDAQVLVIGAGMAGLTAAVDLHKQGIDVMVLEAGPRVGGRVLSATTKLGSHLDLGGQWIGHGHHRISDLATRAKGTIYKTFTQGVPLIVHNGRKVSLFSPSVLVAVIYLVLFDLISRIYVPQSWNSITVQHAISNWVPMETTRELLRLIVSISSTAELDKCSVYSFARGVKLSGGMYTMLGTDGGAQDSLVSESMGSVVTMLLQQLDPSKVRTNSRVTKISQSQSAGVTVMTASGQQFVAQKVIITVPPPMRQSISFDPPLPHERQRMQRNTQMGVVYKAIAVFERPFWRDTVGGEFLFLDDLSTGVSDSSSPGGPGHLCMLVTGTPARQLDQLGTDSRRKWLLSRFVPHMGSQVLQPLEWHEKAWHLDECCGGGYLAFPLVGTKEGFLPMIHKPVNDMHWAGTETAQEHPGYIEGAIQSGERVALEVSQALRKTQQ